MFLKWHRAEFMRHKRRSIASNRQPQHGMVGTRKLHLERLETRALLSFSDIGLDLTGTKNAWGDINNDGWTDLYDGYTVWRNYGANLNWEAGRFHCTWLSTHISWYPGQPITCAMSMPSPCGPGPRSY